ncbi:TIGR02587 family membrane protein [Methyloligella solikamskensis]|uniref:TIGR02587 family membrane protein n=1 Tax=Methyloligella solikamskensis TaxID=1177756 RepID=A0ABW3J8I5_9HYPH
MASRSERVGADGAEPDDGSAKEFVVGLGRAFAGALIFSVPMLMTMEMWWLGFTIEPFRLALLLFLMVPMLTGLSRLGGFRNNAHVIDDVADSLVAIAVAAVSAVIVLALFNLITPEMPVREVVGKVAIQMFPAAIGAILAQNQLGGGVRDKMAAVESSYWGELLILAVGALFLSLNIAPTEEVERIAYQMTVWHVVAIIVLSIVLLHAIVYMVDFTGTEIRAASFLSVFVGYTVVGYAVVALVNLYLLWTFGRTDGLSLHEVMSLVAVISFPGAIGAAFARLIL